MLMNMSVHTGVGVSLHRLARPSLLDVATEVLVTDPSASLARVAEAAGIGRTTLHKQYATREQLMRAVAHRAFDAWELAIGAGTGTDDPDGGLRAVIAALVLIGPQLMFLWRTPAFDRDSEIKKRMPAVEEGSLAVLRRAKDLGIVAANIPDWWLIEAFYSLIVGAYASVDTGHLAPRDAPDRVLKTFLHGIGTPGRDQPGHG